MNLIKKNWEGSTTQATCYDLIECGRVNTLEDARKKELKLYLMGIKPEMNIWQLEKCARIICAVEMQLKKEVIKLPKVIQ
jgi:hypothetical protein